MMDKFDFFSEMGAGLHGMLPITTDGFDSDKIMTARETARAQLYRQPHYMCMQFLVIQSGLTMHAEKRNRIQSITTQQC